MLPRPLIKRFASIPNVTGNQDPRVDMDVGNVSHAEIDCRTTKRKGPVREDEAQSASRPRRAYSARVYSVAATAPVVGCRLNPT